MLIYLMAAATGLLGGLLVAGLSRHIDRMRTLRQAEGEAKELLDRAQEAALALEQEVRTRVEEFEEESMKRFETETQKLVQKNNSNTGRIQEKEEALKAQQLTRQQALDRRQSGVDSRDALMRNKDQKLQLTRADALVCV